MPEIRIRKGREPYNINKSDEEIFGELSVDHFDSGEDAKIILSNFDFSSVFGFELPIEFENTLAEAYGEDGRFCQISATEDEITVHCILESKYKLEFKQTILKSSLKFIFNKEIEPNLDDFVREMNIFKELLKNALNNWKDNKIPYV
ncbi:MAG: hypothetical protein ACTSRG_10980 [Candidatus Helarchaeota archaeon]